MILPCPVAIAGIVKDGIKPEITQADQIAMTTSALTVVDSFVQLVKKLPVLSTVVGVGDFLANGNKAVDEYKKDGALSDGTILGLASSFVAVATLFAGAPLIGAVGLIASAGLGIWALSQPDNGDGSHDTAQFIKHIKDSIAAISDSALNSIYDSKAAIGDYFQQKIDDVNAFIDFVTDFIKNTTLNELQQLESLGKFFDIYFDPELTAQDKFESLQQFIKDSVSDLFDFSIPDSLQNLFAQIEASAMRSDPLVLDLDGDGIETVGLDAGVLFDHNADGVKQGTGWVSADDGMLVRDINGNGTIDSGRELFGDNTIGADGNTASDGFEALLWLDTNQDGVINNSDNAFNELRVWQDTNQDGISQANELSTLAQLGITSINVSATQRTNITQNGNEIAITSSFTRNNQNFDIGQVNYSANTFNSSFTEQITLTDRTKALPDIKGSGGLRSLRQAATLNNDLATAIENFVAAGSAQEQKALMNELIWQWSTTALNTTYHDVLYFNSLEDSNIRRSKFDLNGFILNHPNSNLGKLTVFEAFNGRQFESANRLGLLWESGITHPDGTSSMFLLSTVELYNQELVNSTYDTLVDSIYSNLVLQTRLKPYLDELSITFDDDGNVGWDISKIQSMLEQKISSDKVNGFTDLLELAKFSNVDLQEGFGQLINHFISMYGVDDIHEQLTQHQLNDFVSDSNAVFIGQAGNDTKLGSLDDDFMYGLGGDDTLKGGNGNDLLYGHDGNDYLDGGVGDDVIYGGLGKDNILASDGNDTVYGELGDDNIDGGYGNDALFGGAGDDSIVSSHGNNRLYGNEGNDTLLSGFGDDQLYGGSGNDTLIGGQGNDVLNGGEGDDILRVTEYSATSSSFRYDNNTLIGGKGNDQLFGSSGKETYVFNLGDGQDTIQDYGGDDKIVFGSGILPNNIVLNRVGQALTISIIGSNDSLTVNNWFGGYTIGTFEFTNGSTWQLNDINQIIANGGQFNQSARVLKPFTSELAIDVDVAAAQLVQVYSSFTDSLEEIEESYINEPLLDSMFVIETNY